MSIGFRRNGFEKILIDLNTQCDYLLAGGAVPVANRSAIIPNIRRLMEWARTSATPVVSSLDAHRPEEPFHGMARHCIDRTPGQRKLPFTLLPRRILLHGDNTLDVPVDLFRRYRQVVFTKRTRDLLGNPKADRLLTEIPVTHLIVFGVTTEQCVKATTLAMLARQRNVVIVNDACGFWSAADADLAMRQMDAKGAIMMTTEQIISGVEIPLRVIAPVEEEEDELLAARGGLRDRALARGGNGNGDGAAHRGQEPGGNGSGGLPGRMRRPLGSKQGRLLA